MMAHRGHGHWDGGDRFGRGESEYQLDDSHSAFLELRAGANPLHHPLQHPSLDRRPGASQHFPLSARRIGPTVSRSPSPSHTARERLLLLPESGDDHYSEWMPHASWNPNGPAWQTLNLEHGARPSPAVGPRPDPDPHLEQFTKEPEGTACLREVSRTPSPSPSTIRRPTGRRLPPTPSQPSLLSLAPPVVPAAPEASSSSSPLHLQINFPRLDCSPSRTPGLPAIRLPSMLPSSRLSGQPGWPPLGLGPFHQLEQRLPHIQPLLLSAFDQAVQAGRGQRQLPPMPRGAGLLPGAILPPPSLGHSPSRRIVEDDDEDWC